MVNFSCRNTSSGNPRPKIRNSKKKNGNKNKEYLTTMGRQEKRNTMLNFWSKKKEDKKENMFAFITENVFGLNVKKL